MADSKRNFNPHRHITDIISNLTPAMRYDGLMPFDSWQNAARKKLLELLCLPLQKCDELFETEYRKDFEEYEEIRFSFQSEKGYFVPCHLLIPKLSEPRGTVICIQGHSKGMHISLGRCKYQGDEVLFKNGDRDFANFAIKHGFCALTVEQRDMGECGGTEKGPACLVPTMANLIIGRTTIGERTWDISRAIDVLERHFPEYTSDIWCMGNSGGGTTSFYAACLDERIKTAIVSCAFCSFDDSIAAMPHCTCNFVPNIRRYFDMGELAGLIIPRNLVIVHGVLDEEFPEHGVHRAFEVAKELYTSQNAQDRLLLVSGEAGHRFYAAKTEEAIRKHLNPNF